MDKWKKRGGLPFSVTELRNPGCREKILRGLAELKRETINIGMGSQPTINEARWPMLRYD